MFRQVRIHILHPQSLKLLQHSLFVKLNIWVDCIQKFNEAGKAKEDLIQRYPVCSGDVMKKGEVTRNIHL